MANIITPVFKVSYPNVFKKKLNKLSGKEEYSIVALFPKGADLSSLKKAAKEAMEEKFGKDTAKWPKTAKHPTPHNPFRAHEEKRFENDEGKLVYPAGMEEGGIFINLKSSKNKPEVLNPDKTELTEESEFYAGCYARASVSVFAFKHTSGTWGVSIGLGNLQKVKEGDPLGAKTRAQDDFAPIEGAGGGETGSAEDLFG